MADEEEVQRLRVTFDILHTGQKLSPSAQRNLAVEQAGYAMTVGVDIKSIDVVYQTPDERVVYAHYHNSPEPGDHCRVKTTGCLVSSADGLNQHNAER